MLGILSLVRNMGKAAVPCKFFHDRGKSFWVVPTTGPPQTWPISISAHLLAPFPDPTMHNMYICHKKSGCVRKCEAGARRMRL